MRLTGKTRIEHEEVHFVDTSKRERDAMHACTTLSMPVTNGR